MSAQHDDGIYASVCLTWIAAWSRPTRADSGSSSSRSVPARVRDALKVLELPESASLDDVKRTYRKLARTHHPDLHMQAPESERRKHEAVLKRVNGVYAVIVEWLAPAKASR